MLDILLWMLDPPPSLDVGELSNENVPLDVRPPPALWMLESFWKIAKSIVISATKYYQEFHDRPHPLWMLVHPSLGCWISF